MNLNERLEQIDEQLAENRRVQVEAMSHLSAEYPATPQALLEMARAGQ